ncbi:hypothetical protein F4859DRAFT_528139 [Xylaria cf. heliscus]|nr:hypothetical protein F4859DRAFT_528139 [Xylaria cf. heliscus]
MSAVLARFHGTTQDVSRISSRPVSEIGYAEAAFSDTLDNMVQSPAISDAFAEWRGEGGANAVEYISIDDLNGQGMTASSLPGHDVVHGVGETSNYPNAPQEDSPFVPRQIQPPNAGVDQKAPIQLPGPFTPQYSQWRYLTMLFDGLLALVAVGFIVFAFLVLANDGIPDSPGSLGESLLTAASYGPTIFPVIFAAIIGRTLKLIATWKLQNGSKFGRIEQLLASNTLFGTFSSHIQLRSFDLVGLLVVAIWLASPLGSQASLRTVYPASVPLQTSDEVMFLDPQTPYYMGESSSSSSFQTIGRSLFGSALLYATSDPGHSTQDVWGNLRIPMLEAMGDADKFDWIQIKNASNVTYTSLVGVPINLGQQPGSVDFTLNVSYIFLDCPTFAITNRTGRPGMFTNFSDPNSRPALSDQRNSWVSAAISDSRYYVPSDDAWILAQVAATNCSGGCSCTIPGTTPGNYQSLHTDNCTKGLWPARRLIWESDTDETLSHADCNLHTTYADVNYTCAGAGKPCEAKGVRRSPSPRNPRNATVFDDDGWVSGGGNIQAFIQQFTELNELPGSRYLVPVVAYLMSPDEALTWTSNQYDRNVIQAGRAQFERRLSQLINTLHTIGSAPYTVAGTVPVGGEYNTTQRPEIYLQNITTVPATVTAEQRVIRCDRGWLAALLLSSFTVLAAALASVVIRRRVLVPDVLGSLTLVTLDNRCEDVAIGGSTLDGIERARLLKHVPVRMADVNPGGVHGRLALSGLGNDSLIRNVERSRLYQ